MPIGFPSTPTIGQQFPTVSPKWEWDGTKWRALSTSGIGATPITERLPSIVGTDDSIWLRGGIPYLASAAAQAGYFGSSPAATAPAAMTVGQWSAEPTATPGQIGINIGTLPSDGGSAITALQYRVGTGAAIALTGTGTGLRLVTTGLTAGVAADIQVRAVNAVDADPANWSDVKTRTPAVGSGGGAMSVVNASYHSAFGAEQTITIPAVGSGNSLIIAAWSFYDDLRIAGSTLDYTGTEHGDTERFVTYRHISNVTDGRTTLSASMYVDDVLTAGPVRALVLEVDAAQIVPASTFAGRSSNGSSFAHMFTTTIDNAIAATIAVTGGAVVTGTNGWTRHPLATDWEMTMYSSDLGTAGEKTVTATVSPSQSVRTNTLAYAAV
jgi:hypothetical protein